MAINPRNRQTIFNDLKAYLQSLAPELTDFNTGSILNSIMDAPSAEMEQLWNALVVAFSAAYVATAEGDDLDNKVADFGLTRNPATSATGYVTFGRATAFNQDFTIPAGTIVQTPSTTTVAGIQFETTELVVLPANQLNVSSVPIRALVAGSSGDVSANGITTLSTPPAGIETVTNPVATAGGTDEESDEDLRARVPLYLSSLARGTADSIEAAALSVTGVSSVSVSENVPTPGNVQVYVADSSGQATAALITAVIAKVEEYRAVAVAVQVLAPEILFITIEAWVRVQSGYPASTVLANVQTAITDFLSHQHLGETVYRSALIEAIVAVDGVDSVDTLLETKIVDEAGTCNIANTIDEHQESLSHNYVESGNAAYSVDGVYLYYDLAKVTNFFTGGSVVNKEITLGADLPIVNEQLTSTDSNTVVLNYAAAPGAFPTSGVITSDGIWTQAGAFTISAVQFHGAGLNDATSGGAYTDTTLRKYRIQIDSTGATDTFKWSDTGGTTWNALGVLITGSAQALGTSGVEVTFGATSTHTLNDYWDIATVHGGTNYAVGALVDTDGVTVHLALALPSPTTTVFAQYLEIAGTHTQTDTIVDYWNQYIDTTSLTADVEGVWLATDTTHALTNYYLDGSYVNISGHGRITLGTTTTSPTTAMLKNYWVETGSHGLKPYDDIGVPSGRVARAGSITVVQI